MRIAIRSQFAGRTRSAAPSTSPGSGVPAGFQPPQLTFAPRPGAVGGCERLLDDAALIDRLKKGDQDAAASLVQQLRPTILKCIRRRLPRWASEEDLVQTVFAKVFSRLHQFSGSVPLEHWVARIAINTSLNYIDYESVRPELRMSDLSEEQEAALLNSASAAEDNENQNYAREAMDLLLAELKPEERMIVVLLHIEQKSTREISKLTGLSISSIKVKAFRTRHKMQRFGRRLLRETGQAPAFLHRR
ncbi:MAG TPA: sigma-70 family RNA polymerase sigma factor [Methylomirabilota bacterium]|nr:sigma-70 family RNA polymerase sigma factor [Methylomirabilota bacterium]